MFVSLSATRLLRQCRRTVGRAAAFSLSRQLTQIGREWRNRFLAEDHLTHK